MAVCSAVVNNGLDSWLFLKSLYWACTMTHQVLEEYNSLPTTQTTNMVPQNFWNYLIMVTFENGKNYSLWFKIFNGPIFNSIRKILFAQHSANSISAQFNSVLLQHNSCLADHTATQCDRLLAAACCPSVCLSIRPSVCDAVHCGSQGWCTRLKLAPACS